MTQCSSHAMFEKMMQESIENLADRIGDGIKLLTEQSKANGEALAQVLAGQADRRAMCATQDGRINACEAANERCQKDRDALWDATNKLRYYVYAGVGISLVVNGFGLVLFKMFMEHLITGAK